MQELRSILTILTFPISQQDPSSGNNALHMCAANGHLHILQHLLAPQTRKQQMQMLQHNQAQQQQQYHPQQPQPNQQAQQTQVKEEDPIKGFEKNAEWVNAQNKNGNTPLIWAAMNGQHEIVQELIDRGAIIDIRNESGKTALFYARWDKPQVLDVILKSYDIDSAKKQNEANKPTESPTEGGDGEEEIEGLDESFAGEDTTSEVEDIEMEMDSDTRIDSATHSPQMSN